MLNVRLLLRKHFVVVLGVICVLSAGGAGLVICDRGPHLLDWLSFEDKSVVIGRRIAGLSQAQECTPDRVAYLRDIYSGGNGELSLQIGGDVWALFVRQPQLISRVNAADHRGGFAHLVLQDGFVCYHEYHRRISNDLVEKADVLYRGEIGKFMPNADGLREAWDAFGVRLRPSDEPGYSIMW